MLIINHQEGINAELKGPSDKMLLIRRNMEASSAALFVDNGGEWSLGTNLLILWCRLFVLVIQAIITWWQDLILRPWSMSHGTDWPPLGHGGSPALSRLAVLRLLFLRMAMLIWPRFHCDDWKLLVRKWDMSLYKQSWHSARRGPNRSRFSSVMCPMMCTAHLWDFGILMWEQKGRVGVCQTGPVLLMSSIRQKENCEPLVFAAMCDSGVKIH